MTLKTDSEVYDKEFKKKKNNTSTQNLHTNFITAVLIIAKKKKKAVTKLNGTLTAHREILQ